jgi:hypothetical protein
MGQINMINMFNPKIDSGNVIAISEEDLKEDQKHAMKKGYRGLQAALSEIIQLEQERRSHTEARSAIASAGYL